MQADPLGVSQAVYIYQQLKFWIPLITAGGFLWKAFQGVAWLKGLKGDLLDMKLQLASQTVTLQSQLTLQTTAIVSELKEIRQDFRTAMQPVPPRLARAIKKKVDTEAERRV